MASSTDISEAQGIFIEQLGVEPRVAIRIFGQLQAMYRMQIAEASRDDLLNSARWAADELRSRFDPETLAGIDSQRLRAALINDCPLCASRGSGSISGRKSGSGTPVPAG